MADQPSPMLLPLGWLLIVLGAIWTLLAGGCSFWILAMTVATLIQGQGQQVAGSLVTLLPVMVLCLGPGLGMLFGGRAILRGQRKRD